MSTPTNTLMVMDRFNNTMHEIGIGFSTKKLVSKTKSLPFLSLFVGPVVMHVYAETGEAGLRFPPERVFSMQAVARPSRTRKVTE